MPRVSTARAQAVLAAIADEYRGTADVIRSMCPPAPTPYLALLEERIAVLDKLTGVMAAAEIERLARLA